VPEEYIVCKCKNFRISKPNEAITTCNLSVTKILPSEA
jgi:hypothetical protein